MLSVLGYRKLSRETAVIQNVLTSSFFFFSCGTFGLSLVYIIRFVCYNFYGQLSTATRLFHFEKKKRNLQIPGQGSDLLFGLPQSLSQTLQLHVAEKKVMG